jgi:DNA-binding CsgD family transcriptional regulator
VLEWADRRGSVFAFAQAVSIRAWAASKRGALDEAEADAESARDHLQLRARPALVALIEVRLARGDVAGAAELWRQTRMDEHITSSRTAIAPREARGHLRAALGRLHEALEDLLACGRLEEEWGIRTPAMSDWRSGAAHVLGELGRPEEARRLALESVERCRWFGSPCQLGTALRIAGRWAEREPGLELLAESVHVLERSPARLEHARATFELGAALRRAGRRADARTSLRDAMGLARACGAEPLSVRAHDELVAAGAKPRRDPIESRSRLTASELRVARRAADGLTNREIAQALFLTEKTIEVHLTNSYRKLDIGSRTQLSRALPATPAA